MKEALKLALAALEKVVAGWTKAFAKYEYDSDIPSENQYRDEVFAAIAAIKKALSKPEPVIEIEFLDWVHPQLGVRPVEVEGGKPLILRAKLKEKNT